MLCADWFLKMNKRQNKKTLKQRLGASCASALFAVCLPFRVAPFLYILFLLIQLLSATIPAVSIVLFQQVMAELVLVYQGTLHTERLFLLIGVYLVLQALSSQFSNLIQLFSSLLTDRAKRYIDLQTMRQLASIPMAHFDSKTDQDTIQVVMDSQMMISQTITWIVTILGMAYTFVSVSGVFLAQYPWLALVFLLTYIPGTAASYLLSRKLDRWSIDSTSEFRKKNYYKSLLTQPKYAKELRLFHLEEEFRGRYNSLWNHLRAQKEGIFRKGNRRIMFTTICSNLGYLLVVCYAVFQTFIGGMDVASLTMIIGAIGSMSGTFPALISNWVTYFGIVAPRITQYREFLSWEKERQTGTARFPNHDIPEIRFDKVWFRYPGTDFDVLRGVSFTIRPGEKVALLGINGSGKSTILKLLMRFYLPDRGKITLNGIDIREYELSSIRRLFTACFQEVTHYAFDVMENITLSDIDREHGEERAVESARESGIDQEIRQWEQGYRTPLTRMFDKQGKELSGGQWQKIAIARAFYRDAPVVILDEPSASLDALAEDRIFSSFSRLCRDRTGILVSHRLSNTISCNHIIVLKDGEVCEQGTHEQLMCRRGYYAYLYHLQSERYQEGAKTDAEAEKV